ncbi:MAG: hypothetical protein WC267_01440 [Bacilli bacterium]
MPYNTSFLKRLMFACLVLTICYLFILPPLIAKMTGQYPVFSISEREVMALAGKNFFEDKQIELAFQEIKSVDNTQPNMVTIKELIDRGYLKNHQVVNQKACRLNISYVEQIEIMNQKYKYYLCLFCNNYLEQLTLSE